MKSALDAVTLVLLYMFVTKVFLSGGVVENKYWYSAYVYGSNLSDKFARCFVFEYSLSNLKV